MWPGCRETRKQADWVHASSSVVLGVPSEAVRGWVSDLTRYPQWMPLVHSAVAEGVGRETTEDSAQPAWSVELRAKVGVFARSKRLRMVRTTNEPDHIVFERREKDGRHHAPWILEVRLVTMPEGCTVTMDLDYGGSLWTAGVLDRLLAHHIEEGKKGLAAIVSS